LYLAIAMKNKWIYIGLIYIAAILLLAYEVVFAKKGTPQYYVAMVLYFILLAVYFIRRHRYIKRKEGKNDLINISTIQPINSLFLPVMFREFISERAYIGIWAKCEEGFFICFIEAVHLAHCCP